MGPNYRILGQKLVTLKASEKTYNFLMVGQKNLKIPTNYIRKNALKESIKTSVPFFRVPCSGRIQTSITTDQMRNADSFTRICLICRQKVL